MIGDRSEATFRRLLRKIPVEYLRFASYSDHWKSYRIPLSKAITSKWARRAEKPITLNDGTPPWAVSNEYQISYEIADFLTTIRAWVDSMDTA